MDYIWLFVITIQADKFSAIDFVPRGNFKALSLIHVQFTVNLIIPCIAAIVKYTVMIDLSESFEI